MSATTTTDANGKLATASAGGGGDLSAAVVLDPATSVRNVIQPSAAVIPLTVKGDATNGAAPFKVLRGSDGLVCLSVGGAAGGNVYTASAYELILASGSLWGGGVSSGTDLNFQYPRVTVKAAGAANARLVVTGDAAQTANLQIWQDSASGFLGSVSASGIIKGVDLQTTGKLYWANAGSPYSQVISGLIETVGASHYISDAGKGLKLKSPDGLTTKTVTIDNAGALTLI